jgi:hypothetical protein
MGTNYYVVENHCESCNRYDEKYHIGKSSFGWAFTFRGYKDDFRKITLTSWAEWKEYLKDKMIKDEYGESIDYDDFCKKIETVKSPNYININGKKNLQHNEEAHNNKWFNPQYHWDDPDGYSFSSRDFS